MTSAVAAGTMMIADGTHMPEAFGLEQTPYAPGWSTVGNDTPGQLGKRLEAEGWTFFYMAGEISATGFGSSGMRRAVADAMKVVARQKCNCLEITRVSEGSFLGLHSTTIVGHARHIQMNGSFHG